MWLGVFGISTSGYGLRMIMIGLLSVTSAAIVVHTDLEDSLPPIPPILFSRSADFVFQPNRSRHT